MRIRRASVWLSSERVLWVRCPKSCSCCQPPIRKGCVAGWSGCVKWWTPPRMNPSRRSPAPGGGVRSAGESGCCLALVVRDTDQLVRLLDTALHCVERNLVSAPQGMVAAQDRDRLFYRPPGQRVRGDLAFVFPGAGNCFLEMGRELALRWPEVLRAQDRENQYLASQMFVERFWNATARWRTGNRPPGCHLRPGGFGHNGQRSRASFWSPADRGGGI